MYCTSPLFILFCSVLFCLVSAQVLSYTRDGAKEEAEFRVRRSWYIKKMRADKHRRIWEEEMAARQAGSGGNGVRVNAGGERKGGRNRGGKRKLWQT